MTEKIQQAAANYAKGNDVEYNAYMCGALPLLPRIEELEKENARLREALEVCVKALENSYDVCAWPANGESEQDDAIKSAREALTTK